MLSVSLVVFGGLVLLLGSLVLLVVCSGINDRFDAPPQPNADAGIRDAVTLSADYRGVTWGT
jgi:hypothetical protein